MKKASSLKIYFILILFIFIASCKKSVENKIDGKWKRINVVNVSSDTFEDWEFSDGYFDILTYTINGSTIDTVSYIPGKYIIKMKLFKRILTLALASNSPYNCNWTIKKLTKKYLTIYTTTFGNAPGGMEYREFTKE